MGAAAWAVRRLQIADLRCWHRVEVGVDPGLIVVSGPNGAGKTSLVEAICLGMVGVSPRTARESEIVRAGADAFHVALDVDTAHGAQTRTIGFQPGVGRRMTTDDEPHRSLRTWRVPGSLLVFLPEELRSVKGPPAARRRLIDRLLEGIDPDFSAAASSYAAAVSQRNAMLKRIRNHGADRHALAPWDVAVVEHGAVVARSRSGIIADLAPRFTRWLSEIGNDDHGTLRWEPSPQHLADTEPDDFAAAIAAMIEEKRERDVQAAQTLSGPHRDDVWIGRGDQDLRRTGSQGEQRTAVLAMLLACREVLMERAVTPILLLDDVLSELDPTRRRRLLDSLAGGGQSWITSADPDAADLAAASGATHYLRVEGGRIASTP